MRISSAKKYFALLALLLCQWLMFTHVVHHEVLASEEVCQICLHAPLNAGAAAPDLPALAIFVIHAAPAAGSIAQKAATTPHYTPIRGPPPLVS